MIEFENAPYILHFVELGDYGDVHIPFRRLKMAKKRQEELIRDHDKTQGYFTEISKIIKIRRKEPEEKEQTKVFGLKEMKK
jgi:hypothetical protein